MDDQKCLVRYNYIVSKHITRSVESKSRRDDRIIEQRDKTDSGAEKGGARRYGTLAANIKK